MQHSMHYEVPNLASMLYEYTNKEQDSVINAFRTNNFVQLRDLPNNIGPNNIIQNLQIKMAHVINESSVISQNKKQHLEHLKSNGGFFKRFEYMPDGYDTLKAANFEESKFQKMK